MLSRRLARQAILHLTPTPPPTCVLKSTICWQRLLSTASPDADVEPADRKEVTSDSSGQYEYNDVTSVGWKNSYIVRDTDSARKDSKVKVSMQQNTHDCFLDNERVSKDLSHVSRSGGSDWSLAWIALGSNVGARVDNIEAACRMIDNDPNMRICHTSSLYETKPMYVEQQELFLNGVCTIRTNLHPLQLLDRLQAIEKDLGRVKLIDKGPRNIDLDILVYEGVEMTTDRLTLPHSRMREREFALRPLADIAPTLQISRKSKRVLDYLMAVLHPDIRMYPLTPLAPGVSPLRSLYPTRRTLLMSILNVTPDSFSDGGLHQPSDLDALKATVASHIEAGATIIDVGGQSSRPHAPDISAEEEVSRILPAIQAIKSLPKAGNVAISIDTYRAPVAEAAIKAGAHMINDISGGLLDPQMLSTIARLGCTYIMMHMRGTPSTMQNQENTSYPDGLRPTIVRELEARLNLAQEAGIRRWRIILDPGIGFAKQPEQNLELLRDFHELRSHHRLRSYPWLVGSSRKGFIGRYTGTQDVKDRMEGTAATVTAAVQGGADIVRVHDVKEMARVVKMADAIYRFPLDEERSAEAGTEPLRRTR